MTTDKYDQKGWRGVKSTPPPIGKKIEVLNTYTERVETIVLNDDILYTHSGFLCYVDRNNMYRYVNKWRECK